LARSYKFAAVNFVTFVILVVDLYRAR